MLKTLKGYLQILRKRLSAILIYGFFGSEECKLFIYNKNKQKTESKN